MEINTRICGSVPGSSEEVERSNNCQNNWRNMGVQIKDYILDHTPGGDLGLMVTGAVGGALIGYGFFRNYSFIVDKISSNRIGSLFIDEIYGKPATTDFGAACSIALGGALSTCLSFSGDKSTLRFAIGIAIIAIPACAYSLLLWAPPTSPYVGAVIGALALPLLVDNAPEIGSFLGRIADNFT